MSQLLTHAETDEILSNNFIGRLGCCKDQVPYVVPITYCYDQQDNSIIGYAGVGKKLHFLRKNSRVSFEVDEIEGLSDWKTVIVTGEYIEMKGIDARNALHFFVERVRTLSDKKNKGPKVKYLSDMSHAEVYFSDSVIYRIKIEEKTGRYEK